MDLAIDLACADLHTQTKPNIRATARTYNLPESTLRLRYRCRHTSRAEANSIYLQRLNNEEALLLNALEELTKNGITLMAKIIRQLAEDVFVKGPVGKIGPGGFMKRHKDNLKSMGIGTGKGRTKEER